MGQTEQDRIVAAYMRASSRITTSVVAAVQQRWRELTAYYDIDAEAFLSRVLPLISGGMTQTAAITDAYLSLMASDQLGRDIPPKGVDPDRLRNIRGVPAAEVYTRPFKTARAAIGEGVSLREASERGFQRLTDITKTDMQLANTHTSRDMLSTTRGITGYRRVLTGGENCGLCVVASSQRYHRARLMPIHPGCVPGDSVVSVPANSGGVRGEFAWGQLHAVSRRLFEGELVEFVTAADDFVRVTPNHPVLTDKGWLPADLLSEGDTVFRSNAGERMVGRGPDVHQNPILAEDVFDAARVAFPLVRVPLAAEDFHADGADGEVEIVCTNRHFPSKRDSQVDKESRKRLLVDAHSGRVAFDSGSALNPFIPRGLTTTNSFVSSSGLIGDLFRRHSGSSQFSSGGSATRFDAPPEKFGLENAAVYARQGLHLQRRLAGLVEGDSIVQLRRVGFRGHVFNLHTHEGWYASNNHIVSNCDCKVAPIAGSADPGQVIDEQRLAGAHDAIAARFGDDAADRGARDIDYRKVLLVEEHGEIGPVLTVKSHRFTGPAAIT